MNVYTLDGIPSDLLDSPFEHKRSLKVKSTPSYVTKEIFYLDNGDYDYIIETDIETSKSIKKQYTYNAGRATKIEVTIIN